MIHRTTGRLRGRRLDLRLPAAVTVLSGPTGAGKTSAIDGLVWALTGAAGAARARKEADVHALLGVAGEPVDVRVDLDEGVVRRVLERGERGGFTTKLSASWSGAKTTRDVHAAIVGKLGDVTAIDLGALLALDPMPRRKRLLSICQEQAPAWTPDRLLDRMQHYIGQAYEAAPDDAKFVPSAALAVVDPRRFTILDDEDFYGALVRHVEAAREAVRTAKRRAAEAQAAVEQLSRQAADGPDAPDPARLRAEIERVSVAIEAHERALGSAEQVVERRRLIERQLGAPVADVAALEVRLAAVKQERAEAEAKLAALQASAPPAHVPAPGLQPLVDLVEALEGERAEAGDALAGALTTSDAVEARLDQTQSLIEDLAAQAEGGHPCPVCLGPIGAEAIGRLRDLAAEQRATLTDALAVVEEAKAAQAAAVEALEAYAADLADLREQDAAAQAQVQERAAARSTEIALLRQRLATTDTTAIEAEIQQARRAETEAAALRAELVGLPAVDAGEAERKLPELRAQRRTLQERLAQAERAVQADASYKRAAAARDEALAGEPVAKAAVGAWEGVWREFGDEAVAPFADQVPLLLPPGWELDIDLAAMDFTVRRPGVPPVPVEGLSRGEATIFYAAAAVALASMSKGLRLVVADHAESLTDERAEGVPDGLFVELVRRLSTAVAAGLFDQAVLAHGRMTEREHAAVAALPGVAVVRIEPVAVETPSPEAVNRLRESIGDSPERLLRAVHEDLAPELDASGLSLAQLRASFTKRLVDLGIPVWRIAEALERAAAEKAAGRKGAPDGDALVLTHPEIEEASHAAQ